MNAALVYDGTPQILPSYVAVSSDGPIRRSLIVSTYGERSNSHFCEANSAVQITSERNTSHSPDLASWRWTNWLRCSSADSGNSSSLTVMPGFWSLNALVPAFLDPVVSLPPQAVTSPSAPSIEAGSITLAPSTEPVWPPVPPSPPPSS